MATVFSTATLGLNLNAESLNKDLLKTEKAFDSFFKGTQQSADAFNAQWNDLTSGIKDTKRIISGILISQGFYALSNVLALSTVEAIKFSASMETAGVSLEYFVAASAGTEAAAAQVTAYLREVNNFAAQTPFGTSEVLALSKYMQAVGVSINQTQSVLEVITDTAAATGATPENLQRITFALGQMITKGRIANEEVRQLANANIPIYQILQEELNLTGEQISNIGNYWIDANDAVVGILNGLSKRYDGASDRIAQTMTGLVDTILDDAKIISNIAFEDIYVGATKATAAVRDILEEWREVVTTQGSTGLFNEIILSVDPSGDFGNEILALIGNTRQLATALGELWVIGQPLVSLFGQSLYASLNISAIALTAFADTAQFYLGVAEELGFTTGELSRAIASVYIAYKMASVMAMFGQTLAAGGVAAWNAAQGIASILPASMAANAGITTVIGSVATLAAYLLSVVGIFNMLNNSFAGLDTSGAGLAPDYSSEYEKYSKAMEEYNKAIAAQQEQYRESYEEMASGSTVTAEKDETSDAGGTTSTGPQTWVAAFDEVYDIPDDTDEDFQADLLDDLGELIQLVGALQLPQVESNLPDMPQMDWSTVYSGSMWDGMDVDALQGSFWEGFLPSALLGATYALGRIFSRSSKIANKLNNANAKAAQQTAKTILLSTNDLHKAFTEQALKYDKLDQRMREIMLEMSNPRTSKELFDIDKRTLTLLTEEAEELVKSINEVEDALKLTGDTRLNTSTVDTAKQLLLSTEITEQLDTIARYEAQLLDEAFAMSVEGRLLREELTTLQKESIAQYKKYATTYGTSDTLSDMLAAAGLNLPSLAGNVDRINTNTAGLMKLLASDNYDINIVSDKIGLLRKDLNNTLKMSAELNQGLSGLSQIDSKLKIISEAVKARRTAESALQTKRLYTELQENKDAIQQVAGEAKVTNTWLQEQIEKLDIDIRKGEESYDLLKTIAKTQDKETALAISQLQEQINNNKNFKVRTDKITGQLNDIVYGLRTVESFGAQNIRDLASGRDLLNQIITSIDIAKKSVTNANGSLYKVLTEMSETVKDIRRSNSNPTGLASVYEGILVQEIKAIGDIQKAAPELIAETLTKIINAGDPTVTSSTMRSLVNEVVRVLTPTSVSVPTPVRPTKDVIGDFIRTFVNIEDKLLLTSDTFLEYSDKLRQAYNRELVKVAGATDKTVEELSKIARINRLRSDYFDNLQEAWDRRGATLPKDTAGASLAVQDFDRFIAASENAIGKALKEFNYGSPERHQIGTAVPNTGKYLPLPVEQADHWKSYIRAIENTDLFKVSTSFTNTTDLGPYAEGMDRFGNTANRRFVNSILDADIKNAFTKEIKTVTNQMAIASSDIAEKAAARFFSAFAESIGHEVYRAHNMVDITRQQLASYDAFFTPATSRDLMPADIKVLGDWGYDNLSKIIEDFGKLADLDPLTDALIYGDEATVTTQRVEPTTSYKYIDVTEEGFRRLMETQANYALQIAGQAQVLGRTNAALVIFDKSVLEATQALKIRKTVDLSTTEGTYAFRRQIQDSVMSDLSNANIRKAFEDSMRIIRFEIPKDVLAETASIAAAERRAQMSLMEYARRGATTDELINALQTYSSGGHLLGDPGSARFVGRQFSWKNSSIPEVNEFIKRTIEPLFKTGGTREITRALQLTTMLEEILDDAIRANNGLLETADAFFRMPQAPRLSSGLGGAVETLVKTSTGEMLTTLRALREYADFMPGYAMAAATQLHDQLAKLTDYAVRGLGVEDVAYEVVKNGIKTNVLVSEEIGRTGRMATTLEKMYKTDNALSQSIYRLAEAGLGDSVDIVNPFRPENIYEMGNRLADLRVGAAAQELPEITAEMLLDTPALEESSKAFKQLTDTINANIPALEKARIATESFIKGLVTPPLPVPDIIPESTERTTRLLDDAAARLGTAADELTIAARVQTAFSNIPLDDIKVTLSTDEAMKILLETSFADDRMYTVARPGDPFAQNVSGRNINRVNASGGEGFAQATIFDDTGRLIYEPTKAISDAFADVARVLDGIELSANSFLNFDELLRISVDALDAAVIKGKVAKLSDNVLTVLTEITGTELTKEMTASVKSAVTDIVKSSATTANEFATISESIAEKYAKAIDDSDIATAFKRAIEEGTARLAPSLSTSITGDLASGVDNLVIDEALMAENIHKINEIYEGVGQKLVDTLQELTDGGISEKTAKKIVTQLNEQLATVYEELVEIPIDANIEAGALKRAIDKLSGKTTSQVVGTIEMLTILPEDLPHILNDAIRNIDSRTMKAHADTIQKSVDDVLEITTVRVNDLLGQMAENTAELYTSAQALQYAEVGVETAQKEIADAAAEAAQAAIKTGKSFDIGKFIFGSDILNFGALDVLFSGLDLYFAEEDMKRLEDLTNASINLESPEIVEAMEALTAAGVSFAELGKTDASWLDSIFGKGDLTNAARGAVGDELTIAGGSSLLGAAIAAMGGPAGITAAVVGTIGSLGYNFTGGASVGNQYADAFAEALENDTYYKNAIAAGLDEMSARIVADERRRIDSNLILSDLSTQLMVNDDLNSYLYGSGDVQLSQMIGDGADEVANRLLRLQQALGDATVYTDKWSAAQANVMQTDNIEGMKAVLDYIFKEGNYNSDISREFFENFGDVEMMYLASTEEYGKYIEAMQNMEAFVDALNASGQLTATYEELYNSNALGGIIDLMIGYSEDMSRMYAAQLEANSELLAQGATHGGVFNLGQSAADGTTEDEQQIAQYTTAIKDMDPALIKELYSTLGVTLGTYNAEFTTSSGDAINQLFGTLAVDLQQALKSASGWTMQLPDNVSLNAAALTTQDVEILAMAGIQINSDGTVSFAKTSSSETTGTNRDIDISRANLSADDIAAINQGSIKYTPDSEQGNITIDNEQLAKDMLSAMFTTSIKANQIDTGGETETLSAVGRFLDSGYFEITNKDVLAGNKSLIDALKEVDADLSSISGEVALELARIAARIGTDPTTASQNIIEGSAAVTTGSSVAAEELSEAAKLLLQSGGISTAGTGIETVQVISNPGQQLENGVNIVSRAYWDQLSEQAQEQLEALESLGIDISKGAYEVAIDLSGAMTEDFGKLVSAFIEQPDFWNQLPQFIQDMFVQSGIATQDGWINLTAQNLAGIQKIGPAWAGFWQNMPEDVRLNFEKAGLNTTDGLLMIEENIYGSTLPEAVDGIILKFDQLPIEMQEAITASGATINENGYVVKNATDTMLSDMQTSFETGGAGIVSEAESIGTQVSNALISAMQKMQEFELLSQQTGKSGFLFTHKNQLGTTAEVVNDQSWYPEYNNKGEIVSWWTITPSGIQKEASEAEANALNARVLQRASGGPATGLTLVGERGRELAVLPDGSVVMLGEGGAQLTDLPNGTRVINNDDTEDVMKYTGGLTSLTQLADGNTDVTVEPPAKKTAERPEWYTPLTTLLETITVANADVIAYAIRTSTGVILEELVGYNRELETIIKEAADSIGSDVSSSISGIGNISGPIQETIRAVGIDIEAAIRELKSYGYGTVSGTDVTDTTEAAKEQAKQVANDLLLNMRFDDLTLEMIDFLKGNRSEETTGITEADKLFTDFGNTLPEDMTVEQVEETLEGLLEITERGNAAEISYIHKNLLLLGQQVSEQRLMSDKITELVRAINAAEAASSSSSSSSGSSSSSSSSSTTSFNDFFESLTDEEKEGKTMNDISDMYKKIKGSARGSLISQDALYRLGEGGLSEAILPLERPSIMQQVGSAIAGYITPEMMSLGNIVGQPNGGISTAPDRGLADSATLTADVTKAVLEQILPALYATGGTNDEKTPVYVGTLIADERGLKQLEKKMYEIRQAKEVRQY